ncbi:RING finger protein 112 [Pelodytes ibericus]
MGNSSKKLPAMSQEGAVHFHSLEEDITCSICLCELDQPVSIACGHTFCKLCISSYWATPQLFGYRCPECRKISPRMQLIPVHRLRNLVTKVQLLVNEEQVKKEHRNEPLHLVYTDASGDLQLDETAVTSLFLNDEVSNYPACLLCVIGEKRRGKSFLMNYIMRALLSQEQKQPLILGADDESLKGFEWKAGTDSTTKGIWVWGRPFILEKDGEKMAVYIVDTEGSLDIEGDRGTSIKLSALSMVLSSYLIFNVNSSLKTTEMDYIEMYLHVSELAGKSFSLNSLQHLDILVRDWHDSDNCGREAGRVYIDHVTEGLRKTSKHPQVQETLRSPSVTSFVLPYPGKGITRAGLGRLSDMDEDFRSQLTDYVSGLLRGIWGYSKTDIHGENVTCMGLGSLLKEIVTMLQNKDFKYSSPIEMYFSFENQKIGKQIKTTFHNFKENKVPPKSSPFKVLGTKPSQIRSKCDDEVSRLLNEYDSKLVGCSETERKEMMEKMKSTLLRKQKELCADYSKTFTKCAVGVGFAVGGGVLSLAGGVVGAAVAGTVLAAEAAAVLGSTTAGMITGLFGGVVSMGAIGGGVGAGVGKAIGHIEEKRKGEPVAEDISPETTNDTAHLVKENQ